MFDFQRPWLKSFDELQREMDRYLQHISRRKPYSVIFSQRVWQPAMDVYETTDAVVAIIDLPGVPEDEIQLVVARDSITVRGERKDRGPLGERMYTCMEIPFGRFERTVGLPSHVDPESATARYKSGFLEVVMPKLTAVEPQRVAVSNP
ncbi:MAG TPA: Hsp20/alpha crystallin family protein [Chloroflexota bacterium]|nr:Hsp20/alpha crystallin family protein [Chloroflexota bacterium]